MKTATIAPQIKQVKITSDFWQRYRQLIVKEVLPYQWQVMNDQANIKISDDPQNAGIDKNSHAVANLKIAAGQMSGHHYGFPFQDTDVYKWLEASAYTLRYHPNDDLKKITDNLVDLIAQAQDKDGYLSTYFQIDAPERKFKRLQQSHELYTMGHCIDRNFGSDAGKIHGVDGHPEIELALARLYEVTHEERYLKLAHYFLNERGQDPEFFNKQIQKDGPASECDLISGMRDFPLSYYLVEEPIKDQQTADGHAVRVVYLCTGMAHVARLTGDQDLLAACDRFWNDIVQKRMFITGNIGSTTTGEAFTYDYDLPNDTNYGETCASVGMAFFAKQMLQIKAKGSYADVLEKELFNGALSGMSLDGKHFFYVNPLEADPLASEKNPGKAHILTQRADWFGCACCPANLARLIASVDQYLYTVKGQTILSHQFIANDTVLEDDTRISQTNNFPWEGKIHYEISNVKNPFKFGIRVPNWSAEDYTLRVNDKDVKLPEEDGFVYLDITEENTRIDLGLDMSVKFMQSNNRIKADIGKVAVTRGPIVYCAEEEDNQAPLWLYQVQTRQEPVTDYQVELLNGVVTVRIAAQKEQEETEEALYHEKSAQNLHPAQLRLIPYYTWANRSNGQMLTWLRATD